MAIKIALRVLIEHSPEALYLVGSARGLWETVGYFSSSLQFVVGCKFRNVTKVSNHTMGRYFRHWGSTWEQDGQQAGEVGKTMISISNFFLPSIMGLWDVAPSIIQLFSPPTQYLCWTPFAGPSWGVSAIFKEVWFESSKVFPAGYLTWSLWCAALNIHFCLSNLVVPASSYTLDYPGLSLPWMVLESKQSSRASQFVFFDNFF